MTSHPNRRKFLTTSSLGSILAVGSFDFLSNLPRLSAAEISLSAETVMFDPSIEPLVRFIEETDRSELLEKMGQKIHAGTSYHQVLGALFLAGIRNVQPRPSVGHKFHSVLCINSCHLASQTGPDEDRWLPIFWALDYFKRAQSEESRSSGWRMPAVNESKIPTPSQARDEFIAAMNNWDVERADASVVGLVRSVGATEIFNLFAQFAARDFRSIGHKAIFLANSWRTLQVIGWNYAEPVMRSLTFALLNGDGRNPSQEDLAPDRPWRQNAELLKKDWPANWLQGELNHGATADLIQSFRSVNAFQSAEQTAELLQNGISPQSIWDAVFVGSGELLMRQPGIVGLHGLTTANAMKYIWENSADETLRKRLLLQASSFNTLFRDAASQRGALKSETLDQFKELNEPLNKVSDPNKKTDEQESIALSEIFTTISKDKTSAARQVIGYLSTGGETETLIAAARRTVFQKSRDAHDYKYTSAVLEDAAQVSPEWRNLYVAMSVFQLRGGEDRNNELYERVRGEFTST